MNSHARILPLCLNVILSTRTRYRHRPTTIYSEPPSTSLENVAISQSEKYNQEPSKKNQEYHRKMPIDKVLPADERTSLRVAVIGTPNVGKSAISNCLVKSDVCPTSSLIDTTRENLEVALTEGQFQLVVVDSPGLVREKHVKNDMSRKCTSILKDPTEAAEKAHYILVVYDVTYPAQYIHHRILHLLHRNPHIPSSLVINKIDLLKDKTELLKLTNILTCGKVGGEAIVMKPASLGKLGAIDPKHLVKKGFRHEFKIHADHENEELKSQTNYSEVISKPTHVAKWTDTKKLFAKTYGWPNFDSVFYVSALTGEGIDTLREHLSTRAKKVKKWKFEEDIVTNKNLHDLCREHVRAALLDAIPGWSSYSMVPKIMEWLEPDETSEYLRIVIEIDCKNLRECRYIFKLVNQEDVNQRLEAVFSRPVQVTIHVKYNKKLILPEDVKEPHKEIKELSNKRKK